MTLAEVQAMELKQLWARSWHPIAHASELKEHGDYVCLPWCNDEEVVATNVNGKIIVFNNICPHRGSRIFRSSRGKQNFTCPYHGWSYDGNKYHVPCQEDFDNIPTELSGKILSEWIGDFLYACPLDSSIDTILQFPGELSLIIQTLPKMQFHSELLLIYDCDWKVAVENSLENYHVRLIHKDSIGKMQIKHRMSKLYPSGSSLESFSIDDQRMKNMLDSMLDNFGGMSFKQPFEYIHMHLFPFSALSSTYGYTWSLQHYFPRTDGRTYFISRLYTAIPDNEKITEDFFNSAARFNEQVFKEDAQICQFVRPNHLSNLGKQEERVRHFRKYFSM